LSVSKYTEREPTYNKAYPHTSQQLQLITDTDNIPNTPLTDNQLYPLRSTTESVKMNEIELRTIFSEMNDIAEITIINEICALNNDPNGIISQALILLVMKICKYVDFKSKQNILQVGFTWLYQNCTPNIEDLWKSYKEIITLESVPNGMKELMIHIFLCYSTYVIKTKRSKYELIAMFKTLVDATKLDKFKPRKFLIRLIEMTQTFKTQIRPSSKRKCETETSRNHVNKSAKVQNQNMSLIQSAHQDANQTENQHSNDRSTANSPTPSLNNTNSNFSQHEIKISSFISKLHLGQSNYISMSNMKPNKYISNAMNHALLNILDSSLKDADMECHFSEIIKDIILHITAAILGESTTNQTIILQTLTKNISKKEIEAINVVITILPLIYRQDDTIASVQWGFVKEWCILFSSLLNQNLLDKMTTRLKNNISSDESINELYFELRESIEKAMRETCDAKLLSSFKELSHANEMAAYILFGTNYVEQKSGGALYTDLVTKTLILLWKQTKEIPPNFSKTPAEKYKNNYMCLPIAFLTNLKQFGMEEKKVEHTICSINDFLHDSLEET